jgi:colanic acid biosynthesis glycosyl transferase WcaI
MVQSDTNRKTVFIYYHFLPPDEVVSAIHFGDLAEGLAKLGWQVIGITSHRVRHDHSIALPSHQTQDGYEVIRLWRPPFNVSKTHGRILAAAWMIAAWMFTFMFFKRKYRPDVCLFGTDPIMSLVLAPWIKFVSRSTKVATWYFDVYPDALVADRMIKHSGMVNGILRAIERRAWKGVDLIFDLGHCMQNLLKSRATNAKSLTIYPWSLLEPSEINSPSAEVRNKLFGTAKIGLLYSGNLGHAHEYKPCLSFMSHFTTDEAHLHFACRGSKLADLKDSLHAGQHPTISLGSLVPEEQLALHLTATDIHVVTLADDWTGIVVPSKTFGALAVGRPVLFFGPPTSEIARLIKQHQIGWVIESGNESAVAIDIRATMNDEVKWHDLTVRCFKTYRELCSKQTGLQRMDQALRNIIET